ncbi:MAG: sulfite exporter TauE/SafE family protein [Deltaproteobacteria bacterium]|nr:sulfite exporter TauE/SafE family protein [Deltaproteobacteria bacterium]
MALTDPLFFVLVLTALLTSMLSGVLGMGGGATLLGAMSLVLPSSSVVPLHAVVQLVSNLTRTLALLKKVRWAFALPFILGLPFGLIVARFVMEWMSGPNRFDSLKGVIGVVLLLFLLLRKKGPKRLHLPRWGFFPLGFFGGLIALFVGALGPFVSPFFLREDLEPEEIVATKAASLFLAHLLKIPAMLSLGFSYAVYAAPLGILCICVVVGTLLGRAILAKVKRETFVKLFEAVLFILGVTLIAQSLFF